MARAFDLAGMTKNKGLPVLRAVCEGEGTTNAYATRFLRKGQSCVGSNVPALANNARTEHLGRKGANRNPQSKGGHPPDDRTGAAPTLECGDLSAPMIRKQEA